MIEVLKNIDAWLLLLINSDNNPFFDGLMWWISGKFIWIPLYLFLLFKLYQKYQSDIWKIFIIIALTIGLSDGVSSGLIKKQVKRYRPSHHLEIKDSLHLHKYQDGTYYAGGKYGFVSSHAANSTAIVVLILLLLVPFSKQYYWMIMWALIVSYSRMYLGVHYPLDIIGGILVGILSAYIAYLLGVKFLKFSIKREINSNFEA